MRRAALFLTAFCTFILTTIEAPALAENHARGDVKISEIAWAGTDASANDEWLELYNTTETAIDLTGWTLAATDGAPSITLVGTIAAGDFFLLERTDDTTVNDIAADQIYTGSLGNGGETLHLRDSSGTLIDTANTNGGDWPAGSSSPRLTMERITLDADDFDSDWVSNDGVIRNGEDANGAPISGTPRMANSTWNLVNSADLAVTVTGPPSVDEGAQVTWTITVVNRGTLAAENASITNTFPENVTYVSDTFPTRSRLMETRTWLAGSIEPDTTIEFTITGQLAPGFFDDLINHVEVESSNDANPDNNADTATSAVVVRDILFNGLYFDSLQTGDAGEAIQLINISDATHNLNGWRIGTSPTNGITIATDQMLAPGEKIWITRDNAAFQRQFAALAMDETNLTGSLSLSNNGTGLLLYDADDNLIDTVVYENGSPTTLGWDGPAIDRYRQSSTFATEGQIIYRMRDQVTGAPVPDTDTANDWAQSTDDPINGRKLLYPGWDLDAFFQTAKGVDSAELTVAIGPDSTHNTVQNLIAEAQTSIKMTALVFTNLSLMEALVEAAERGVEIDLLQEGAPPGGLDDQQRYLCQLLDAAGGHCWFMINEPDVDVFDRYKFTHAKYILIDGERVAIGSDNYTGSSMPYDDFSDGTAGRRGVLLITDAPTVVERVQSIWAHDFDPPATWQNSADPVAAWDAYCLTEPTAVQSESRHCDIFPWNAEHTVFGDKYGAPEPFFFPDDESGGITYTVRFTDPVTFNGTFEFEVVSSPENSLRTEDSLLGLVNRAGAGDVVYAMQLDERSTWGDGLSVRTEAYIEAARRGADVRVLLNGHSFLGFVDPEDPPENYNTCAYLLNTARQEGLPIKCAVADPTGLGIHAKMVLVEVDGAGYVHLGSINGSEQSSKGNREVALQVQSNGAFDYLRQMFLEDFPVIVYLPLLMKDFEGRAQHPLITEVLVDTAGIEDLGEFIEIANPTNQPIDISGWSVGDAQNLDDFEDVRIFPEGTVLQPRGVVVVAYHGLAVFEQFGFMPDFEILNSSDDIPGMIDDPRYHPDFLLRLANGGDEVFLRDTEDNIIDVINWGNSPYQSTVPAPAPGAHDTSLERFPYWNDSDNNVNDLRLNFPNPGQLPN